MFTSSASNSNLTKMFVPNDLTVDRTLMIPRLVFAPLFLMWETATRNGLPLISKVESRKQLKWETRYKTYIKSKIACNITQISLIT